MAARHGAATFSTAFRRTPNTVSQSLRFAIRRVRSRAQLVKHRHPFPLRGEVDNRISPPLFAVFYTIDGFPYWYGSRR